MKAELALEFAPIERPTIRPNSLFHVGVSGGKDSSAALAWMVYESGIPREKIVASFCDISNDHPATLEHIALLSAKVHPIETIKPELGFFDLAAKRGRFPSSQARFCTESLKIEPTQRHITKLFAKGFSVIAVSGVRGDESEDRSELPEWDYSGSLLCFSWRPLIRWTLADVFDIHRRYGIPLNPLYAMGARRVGCWPCFMCQKREIRLIALNDSARIDTIRHQESVLDSTFFSPEKTPFRFRSKACDTKDGRTVMAPTIDDVVKWSMTGKGGKGSYLDEPQPDHVCHSGFCE